MKDLKSIIRSVAPVLATALGGPFAGMAAKKISEGLLGKSEGTDSQMYEALLDPTNLHKLKEIENAFEIEMKELDVDLEKVAVDDRKSARALAESNGTTPQVILSSLFIMGFFLVLVVLFSGLVALTDSIENLAFMLLGVLASGVTVILKFWFGGSPHDGKQMENIYNSIPKDRLKK